MTELNLENKAKTGWLAISTEGFAQQNAARPKEHLVKELVQNALDALPETGGGVSLSTQKVVDENAIWITCVDTGEGVADMDNLRTVFWTSKQDSHLKRGRMGRGFKELLCLALEAEVRSRGKIALFSEKNGEKDFEIKEGTNIPGTEIRMKMPWDHEETRATLKSYFQQLLPPPGVEVMIEGVDIPHRAPARIVEATLTTESFREGRWVKPSTKTRIELVALKAGEKEGMIYEMGIPICPVEWTAGYHANILQRVPMNPNRDAVMSGYPAKIHRACLPALLPELEDEAIRESWVGEAASHCGDKKIQQEVLGKAFGDNLARSVPGFGKFDHDADAREHAKATVLDTKQLCGGFREMARALLPTSREVAEEARAAQLSEAVTLGFSLVDSKIQPTDERKKFIDRYGEENVKKICEFHKWFAERVMAKVFPEFPAIVTVHVACIPKAEATWSHQDRVMTLSLSTARIWKDAFHRENFALIVHETAHELAAHHGESFARAMEITAGAALQAFAENTKELEGWKEKLS
jgi:hypothetical protein